MQEQSATALSDLRVLDLAGPMGLYCTKLLADLGADVIKVEPPGGDPCRRIGPFFQDMPHPERSLYFFNFNTNKRSITLNLETKEGRGIFKRMAARADIIVETYQPGYLHNIGLGCHHLRELNPGIIMTSITGFGQTGPYSHYRACDLVGLAMSGLLYHGGYPEDPPTRAGGSQACYSAGTHGAVGTLIALLYRDMTGEGQHVDVSMQEATSLGREDAVETYDLLKQVRKRMGRLRREGITEVFPCKDGYIICAPLGGGGGFKVMLGWMAEEGLAGDLLKPEWQELLELMGNVGAAVARLAKEPSLFHELISKMKHVEGLWEKFLANKTKREFCDRAQRVGVNAMPVFTVKELMEDPHLLERQFFVEVEHPELKGKFKYPGPPFKMSETPCRIARRAPLIGEHNQEVYEKELGFSQQDLCLLKAQGVL